MSGRLQVATKGVQNKWIDGNPVHSHFLFSLNSHSKFAFDILENPITEPAYGKESICMIPLDAGDLITQMTLRYQIFFKDTRFRNYMSRVWAKDNPAIHLIEHIDLFLGGVHIQRITSDWMNAYNTIQYEKTLRESTQESAAFVRPEFERGRNFDSETQLPSNYLNLPLYFNDNLKSAILACKLTKQNCYIKIKFRRLSDVLQLERYTFPNIFYEIHRKYDTNENATTEFEKREIIDTYLAKDMIISNASILTQYAYLDTNELNYILSRPMKQIITQLQLKRFDILKGETKRVSLNFKHPIKILYFFVGPKNKYEVDAQYMYNIRFSNAKLLFNNQVVFDDGPEKLIYYNSKMNTMSGIHLFQEKKEIGSYSFALSPLSYRLSGHVNFSRIIDQKFEMTLPDTENIVEYASLNSVILREINECQVYAVNYNVLHYSGGLVGLRF
tara:strand:- start:1103 stop:2434 length:1332 start_codon:yes stop_codon:yes gene_type:complete